MGQQEKAEKLELADYSRAASMQSIFRGWIDTITNIPCLPVREKVYIDKANEYNRPILMCLE